MYIRKKLGRNKKCHCGSGKKYKKCCLDEDEKNFNRNMLDPDFYQISEYIKDKYKKNVLDISNKLTASNYKYYSDMTVEDKDLVLICKKIGFNRDIFQLLIDNNNKNNKSRYYICHNDRYLLLTGFNTSDIDKAFPEESANVLDPEEEYLDFEDAEDAEELTE